jgi:hypothetical protein
MKIEIDLTKEEIEILKELHEKTLSPNFKILIRIILSAVSAKKRKKVKK